MSTMGRQQIKNSGFTFVELLIVVLLLALLSTAAVTLLDSALIATTKSSRDTERKVDMQTTAQFLERHYRLNPSGSGSSYPTTDTMASSLSSVIPNSEVITPPGTNTPALTVATDASTQSPDTEQYIYQPLNSIDALCTDANDPCVRFLLYYKTEADDTVETVESRHQQ